MVDMKVWLCESSIDDGETWQPLMFYHTFPTAEYAEETMQQVGLVPWTRGDMTCTYRVREYARVGGESV